MDEQLEYDETAPDPVLEMIVPRGVLGERLDKQLAKMLPEHSRARLQGWIESGCVQVNHQVQQKVRVPVSEGDVLTVATQPSEQELAFVAQPVDFEVVAESENWIVVNKPAGLVVHPGAGNWQGTLLNGLLYRYPELASVARAGIVHRLDKDTSGLMVVARNAVAQTSLVRQLQARSVSRCYVAMVHGHLKPASGTVDRPIGRDPRVAVRMSVDRPIASKEAITDYEVLQYGHDGKSAYSWVRCRLRTGRTHQIRVHLASLNAPLVGDVLYGGRTSDLARRQLLHAYHLEFDDPSTGQLCSFETELAVDILQWAQSVQWTAVSETGQEEDDYAG